MIVRKYFIIQKILVMNKKYDWLEYESRRVVKRKNFEEQEENMKKFLEAPVNFLKQGKWQTMQVGKVKKRDWLPSGEEVLRRSGILDWEEEMSHLQNQLSVEQPGQCAGVDKKQLRRDKRKQRTELNQSEKNTQNEILKKRPVKVILDEEEETGDRELSDEDNDDNFTAPKARVAKNKPNVMWSLAGAADRMGVSRRGMTMMGAAAEKGMGKTVDDIICSPATAWRQRTARRKELSNKICGSFNAPDAVFLHWDGKTLKLRRGQSGHFVAIYVSGVKDGVPSQLLGVPQAPGGKGKEEFELIKTVLEAWGIRKE